MQVRDKIADCAALRSTRGRGELQWSLSVHPPRKRPDEDAGRTREPRIVRVNTRENGRSSTVEKQPDEGNGCPRSRCESANRTVARSVKGCAKSGLFFACDPERTGEFANDLPRGTGKERLPNPGQRPPKRTAKTKQGTHVKPRAALGNEGKTVRAKEETLWKR